METIGRNSTGGRIMVDRFRRLIIDECLHIDGSDFAVFQMLPTGKPGALLQDDIEDLDDWIEDWDYWRTTDG